MISISGKEWKEYKIPKRLIDKYSNDFDISENLSKFDGIALPGGVTLSAAEMKSQAQEEITKLEEESRLNYELPVMDLMG